MNKLPSFSVFIPVYNGAKYLYETLLSLKNQTYKDFNVFLVDDGSSDRSIDIIRNICDQDSRFRLYQKKNEGCVPYSWRYILPKLDGRYVQYMSQDDVLEEEYFAKIAKTWKVFSVDEEPDAIVSSVEFWHGENSEENHIDQGWQGGFESVISGREAYEAALDYSVPGFCCWKREILTSCPFKCEAFNSDELMQRLWFLKCKRVVFSEALFKYRQNNREAITKTFSYIHYSSLRTNLSLLESMKENQIREEKILKMGSDFYQGLFVLMRQFYKYEKNYTEVQQDKLKQLFEEVYRELRQYSRYSSQGLKNCIYRFTAWKYCNLKIVTFLLR